MTAKRLAWLDPVANWANDRAEGRCTLPALFLARLRDLINKLQGREDAS